VSLSHLVSLQRQGSGQSSTGQPNGTWTELAKEWAEIEPISGREYFNASGERAEVTHKVKIRAGRSYLPKDRVVYGSRVFNIRSVLNLEERGRWLQIMVTEVPG
jgi:SPP1 family predicted phage head-tail adaptor